MAEELFPPFKLKDPTMRLLTTKLNWRWTAEWIQHLRTYTLVTESLVPSEGYREYTVSEVFLYRIRIL